MAVCNTFLRKENSKLITYQSEDNKSMIYYLMVRKTDRCLVKDVNSSAFHNIEWLLVIPMKPQTKKIVKFVPKPRVWNLKDEDTARLFTRCCCCMPSETYGKNGATPIFRSFHRTASSTTGGWSRLNILMCFYISF